MGGSWTAGDQDAELWAKCKSNFLVLVADMKNGSSKPSQLQIITEERWKEVLLK
jgi:hypothetical protein